jgi:hypothetical protein
MTQLDQVVRYIWTDEDGEQVSPLHKTFVTALAWREGWEENWERLQEQKAEFESNTTDRSWYQRRLETLAKSIAKMSLTGKPPVDLHRHVATITIEPLSEKELVMWHDAFNPEDPS